MAEKRCYTVKDLQEMLDVSRSTVYKLLRQNEFRWIQLEGGGYRISKKSFDEWLDKGNASVTYGILSSKKYAPLLDVIVIAGRRRVTKESFERFLQAQDTYELFNFEYEELELKEKREYENYK